MAINPETMRSFVLNPPPKKNPPKQPSRYPLTQSPEISPRSHGVLTLPSPYHDDYDRYQQREPPRSPFESMFKRFRYVQVTQGVKDEENMELRRGADSPATKEPKRRKNLRVHWTDDRRGLPARWSIVLFMILLMSILFNLFFVFGTHHLKARCGSE